VVSGFCDEDFVSIEMERGDTLLFSAFLVHRSGTNRTESIPWSAQFRFNNLAKPTFIRRGYPHAFIYKPVQELLTPDFTPDAESLSALWKD
jgi:phytanoyl-CoA hydroxylase